MLCQIAFCFLIEATSLLECATIVWIFSAFASNCNLPPFVLPKAPFDHVDSETSVYSGLAFGGCVVFGKPCGGHLDKEELDLRRFGVGVSGVGLPN